MLLILIPFLWVSSSRAQADVVGQWTTLPYQMPINPVHSALLNNGKVLIVSGSGWVAGNTNYLAAIWDPVAGTITQQKLTWDMFCSGISILPDGRPFVVSGTLQYDPFEGLVNTAVYNPSTGQFTNMQNLAHGRWYPTTTVLGDGRILAFSGLTETGKTNSTVEIYTVGTGWSTQYASPFTPPLYPWMHLLPNGNVFFSGSSPISAIFNPTTDTWTTNVATTNYGGTRTYGTSVMLPLTPANGYKPVVMIMGGANPATATTELIDLSVSKPKWVYGPSMSQARIEMSSVILPSGQILALGGSANDEDSSTAGLNADLYDPVSNTFSPAGTNAYPHLYHSVALLLPDATVMITGGNPQRGSYESHMEVYSPAYLFTTDSNGQAVPATRPTISSLGSSTLAYGGTFTVNTPDAANISSVVLVRPGADTHAFNFDQRLAGLNFTTGSGLLHVTAPPNSNIAPPGYYMLFLLNSSGVPSVASFVQLPVIGTLQPPTGAITSPATNTTIGVGQSVIFAGTGTDPNPNGSITGYSWVFPGGTPAASSVQNPGAVTFSAAGTDVASLTVTDNSGLSDPNPPTRTITVVPGFTLSVTPASQTVSVGNSTSYTATVTPGTNFTGTVNFTLTGLPTGATASFSPTSVTGSGSSTLTVSTLATTPTGTYTLTIKGTAGTLVQTATVTLVANNAVDFSITTAPSSQSVTQGGGTTFTSTIAGFGGFSGTTTFSVSGLPAGVTGTFSPTTVTGSGSTNLNVAASATATTGAYTITITAISGSLTHSSTTNLLVLSSSPVLVSIAVTPASPSIFIGGTQQFIATGTYSDSSTQNLTSSVTWTSSTPAAATINSAGLATGVASGTTTIKAASGAFSGSVTLTVTSALTGLVGHWTFDAGSGTTAVDSSGSGYTATLFNGVTWVPGKIGNAISANNTNQYASTASINLTATSAVTVAAWVNRTYTSGGTNGNTLFEFSSNFNNVNNAFAFFPDEAPDCGVTAMEIGIDGNVGYNIKCYAQPTSGVWHHLAVVYDMTQAAANEVNLYIDGVLQTALSQSYNSNNIGKFGTYPLYLFSRAGTTSFSGGQMDDLQLYNRALSATEVKQVYTGVTPSADFTLASLPASQTVVQGNSTTYTAIAAAANGFSGTVAFTVSGLPAGATAAFSPASVTGSGTSTLTVTTASTTPTGTYPLTITGTSGSLVHTSAAMLVVSAPADFTLNSSTNYESVNKGSSITSTITIAAVNAFSGTVAFSVTGLPAGATGTFVPSSLTASGTSTLTITTAPTTLIGNYTVTVTGTSGSLVHTADITLEVNAPPDFTLTASPVTQTVAQGAGTTYTPTVAAVNGFTGAVAFTVSGLPTGATGTFSPTSVTGSGISTLTVTTAATTPAGSYTLTITGTSGSLVHTTTTTLVVALTPDFTLASSPASQSVIQGGSTTYTPTIAAVNGFSGAVAFTVSGLPTGATGAFNPASVTASGTSTLTVTTAATTPTGTYTLTITGTSGSLTHSSTVSLVVQSLSGATLTSIAVTPANNSVVLGGTQQYIATGIYSDSSTQNLTSTVTWTSSIPAAATINAAGLATGIAAGSTTIKATSGAISGSATLTVATTLSGLAGHWTFDAGSGTTAVDSSGNGHTATLFNGVTWVPGKIGDAISANGTNQYASTAAINLSGTNAVTVAMWLNRTYTSGGTSGTTLFEFSDNYNNYSDAFSFFPDEAPDCGVTAMEIGIDGNAGYNLKCYAQPTSGVWHHLAVVYDMSQAAANEVNLYIDGVLQTALTQDYNSNNTGNFGNHPLYLYSRAGSAFFAGGQMDDLQLYSRALSASEVKQVYSGITPSPDFALASLPASQSVTQGGSTMYTAAAAAANGFSGVVALSVSGLPTGATGTFSPSSVTGSGTSTLTVTTSATTPAGTYTLTFTGTSGTLTHTATSTLVVSAVAGPDFTLSSSPTSQTVVQGSSTTYTPSVTAVNGFSAPVGFTVSGLPTGATGTFNPTSVTGSGTSTLTVKTASTTPAGSYTLTITGTSGSLVHTATATLVVNSAPNFTLTSSPASQSVNQGGSTTYTQTVTATGGFTSVVGFTVSGLPTGATGTFSPTSVTGSGTSTLTVKTASTTPTGTYTLTITGTSGSLVHTATATLVVSTPGVPGGVDGGYVTVSACNAPEQSCIGYIGGTVPTGDAILVIASWGGTSTTATVSDGVNTYTSIAGPINAAAGTNRGQAWIAKSSGAGVTQAAVTLSAPTSGEQILIWVVPLTGIDPTSPIDANVTHFTGGNGTSMTTGTSGVASAFANEMIWGVFLEDNYSSNYTPGSGFTSISGQEAASLLEYKNVAQTGTQSATGTNGNGTNNWIGLVFGLKAAGQ